MTEVAADVVRNSDALGWMWGITVTLAGALGTALYRKMSEMAEATEKIAETVQRLANDHARVDERVAGHERRIDRLERAQSRDHFDA